MRTQKPMPDLIPSPSEILAARISDIETSRAKHANAENAKWAKLTAEQMAFNRAGLIAIKCVLSSAACGNVQCKQAEREIAAFLQIIFNPTQK